MSDRTLVINMHTYVSKYNGTDSVKLFMDGESGTWRLFVADRGNSDFSLQTLREFRDKLTTVFEDIERDPEHFNAETRATREDA